MPGLFGLLTAPWACPSASAHADTHTHTHTHSGANLGRDSVSHPDFDFFYDRESQKACAARCADLSRTMATNSSRGGS